jgi:hypothetical protein
VVKHTRSLRSALAAALLIGAGCIGAPIDEGTESDGEEVTVSRNQAALVSTCSASTPINPLKELFIVDPSVVNSAEANNAGPTGGALSFHRTMRTLAGGQDVAAFTERFFNNWLTTQFVGRGVTEARPGVSQLLNPSQGFWPRKDGKLDMEKAPFRLLGVVNRMDLLGTAANKPNGEGRLVYGLFFPGDETRDPAKGIGQTFSIIFEFNLPTTHSLRDWATRWHQMGALKFGLNTTGMNGVTFNNMLFQNVVNEYVAPQNLSQVRTNEIQFAGPWQLREFSLQNGQLVAATTKQSPEPTLNNSAELLNYVKANKNAILSNTHVVPSSLLGGTSNEDFPRFCGQGPCDTSPDTFAGTRWLMTTAAQNGIEESVRFAFANQTCNGCHNSDVHPTHGVADVLQFFYQVAPTLGVAAGTDGTNRLSDFVKNQELPLRTKVLSGLLSCNCMATYNVVSGWDTGSTASVRVTNIGATNTSNWDVKWRYASDEHVTSNWESQRVTSVVAPNHEFKNLSWNGSLAPGQSVQFGLNTAFTGLAPIPTELVATCQ